MKILQSTSIVLIILSLVLPSVACSPEMEAAALFENAIEFELDRQLGIPKEYTHQTIEQLEEECCTIS